MRYFDSHLSGRALDLILSGLSGLLGDSAFFDDAGFACFLVCERLLVPGCPDCRECVSLNAETLRCGD